MTLQQDLTGADLHGKDLTEVRLQGKVLAQANLVGATLRKARLVETDLRGADLRNANLQDADLRGAQLAGASLDGANLTGARLKDADLTQASLPRAVLTEVQFQNANLVGACLAGAHLQHADLGGVELAGAVFTGADVEGAKFESDLRPASGLDEAGLAQLRNWTKAEWPREFGHASAVGRSPDGLDPAQRPRHGRRFAATVSAVSDGDTLRLEPDRASGARLPSGGRAALIGVNAPDPDDADGPVATRFLTRSLSGKRVRVQVGDPSADDGGRLLVYVRLSGERTVNEMVLEAGRATYRDDGNTELRSRLRMSEIRAKRQGVGLWERCPTPEERVAPEGVKIRTT